MKSQRLDDVGALLLNFLENWVLYVEKNNSRGNSIFDEYCNFTL